MVHTMPAQNCHSLTISAFRQKVLTQAIQNMLACRQIVLYLWSNGSTSSQPESIDGYDHSL